MRHSTINAGKEALLVREIGSLNEHQTRLLGDSGIRNRKEL